MQAASSPYEDGKHQAGRDGRIAETGSNIAVCLRLSHPGNEPIRARSSGIQALFNIDLAVDNVE